MWSARKSGQAKIMLWPSTIRTWALIRKETTPTCDTNQLKKRNRVGCGRASAVSRFASPAETDRKKVPGEASLSGRQNFGRGDASQFVNAEDRIFDQVVRTRGAGRDANDDGTTGEPMVGHNFSFFVEVVVSDAGR